MSGGARLPAFVRRGLPAALLLVTAACMAATVSPAEIARRGSLLLRSLAGETIATTERTGFWFDPAYGIFLEEVRSRTPRDATIAVVLPPYPDVYVYQAAYQKRPAGQSVNVIARKPRVRNDTWICATERGRGYTHPSRDPACRRLR